MAPVGAVTVSYPLGKHTESAFHMIEPTAQGVFTLDSVRNNGIPNTDSQDAELDDLNIFSINRFPGRDRFEDGTRFTLGVRYQRIEAVSGPNFEATFGQSYRLNRNEDFSAESGLRDITSDFVGSWRIYDAPFYNLGHRFRVSDSLELKRNEVYLTAQPVKRWRFEVAYVFLEADAFLNSNEDRAEIRGSTELDLTDYWTIYSGLRRDLELDRFVTASGGIRYSCDECIEVDFSVGRRFNNVEDAPSSTNVGLTIRLKTIGDR